MYIIHINGDLQKTPRVDDSPACKIPGELEMEQKYKHHRLADQFPMMSDAEFKALKNDIEENGLQEPISIYQNKILDGRNRYKACLELEKEGIEVGGIAKRFKTLKISLEEATALSVSQNLQRRHLTKSQQAMYIVRSGLLGTRNSPGGRRKYRTGDSAIRRISKRYGVSHVSIYKARFVDKNDPDNLAAKVLNGELSVAKAENIIRGHETESESDIRDSLGQEVPKTLRELFQLSSIIGRDRTQLNRIQDHLSDVPEVIKAEAKGTQQHVQIALDALESITAHSVCKDCSGKGCGNCGGKGWYSPAEWKRSNGTH